MKKLMLMAMVLMAAPGVMAQNIYATSSGHASFFSEAPIANVDAQNENVKATLNTSTGEVTFGIAMKDFQFKNQKMGRDAQRNYIETDKYPEAGFRGKISGRIDYDKPGSYPATAMGKLKIHGVEKTVTEKGTVKVTKGKITLQSQFYVVLKDYNISTPSILGKKMTEENILVKIEAALSPQAKNVASKK